MLRFPGTHGTEIHIQLIETSACKPTRSNRRPHPAGAHQRVAFRWIEVAIAFVELPDIDMLRALDCSLCPFVRVPHIEQRPVFARARKAALDFLGPDHRDRSEERRVGKECVSTCRSRWSQSTSKNKQNDVSRTQH